MEQIEIKGTISRSKDMTDKCTGCGKDKHKLFHACTDCFNKGAFWQNGQLKWGDPLPWYK
jgi:hypothetical protein